MPLVPGPPDFADGVSSSSQMNQVRDAIKFGQSPPVAKLKQTSAQSIANSTSVAITLNAEDVDSDVDGVGGHDNVTNNTRYTARYAGWYWIGGGIGYASNATGVRIVEWWINGILVDGSGVCLSAVSGVSSRVPARAMLIFLAIGDYVECMAFQTSGGALNTAVSSAEMPSMNLHWTSR